MLVIDIGAKGTGVSMGVCDYGAGWERSAGDVPCHSSSISSGKSACIGCSCSWHKREIETTDSVIVPSSDSLSPSLTSCLEPSH